MTWLHLVNWHLDYRSDLEWLSICLVHLSSTFCLDFVYSHGGFAACVIYCRFWWIVRQIWLRVRILACMCGVIQGLDFLLGFDFPTWIVATNVKMLLKREILRNKFGFSWRFPIFDSTSARPINAITPPSSRSRNDRLLTDLVIYLDSNREMIEATNRFC